MAGELLIRVLKRDAYQKALAAGPITAELENDLFMDAGNWNLIKTSGEGWVILDNADFSDTAWDVIISAGELPLLEGFECEEACPTLVTDKFIKLWETVLSDVLSKSDTKPVVREIANALYELVRIVKAEKSLELTVTGLL